MEQLLFVHHRIKVDIISYLKKFVLNLLRSLSQPTRVLAAIIQSDIYSVSGRNLVNISVEARIDLLAISRMTLVEKFDKHSNSLLWVSPMISSSFVPHRLLWQVSY